MDQTQEETLGKEKRDGMDRPLISIVVPVYNVEAYLDRCMASLLGQTYPNIEIILVDDASTDASGAICDRYAAADTRIRSIRLAENSGVSHARNEGIRQARGEYISFVDPDDYVRETMLSTLYASLVESGADISVCGVEQIGFGKKTSRYLRQTPGVFSGQDMFFSMIRHELMLGVVTKLYPTELIRTCRFREDIHYGEDFLFLYHLLQRVNTAVYTPEPLYCYVCRADSATQRLFYERQHTHSLVYEYFHQEALEKFPQYLPQLKQTIVVLNVRMAVNAVESRTLKGKQLDQYLKIFRGRVRRYCDRATLARIRPRMVAAETVLLLASAKAFWAAAAVYKWVQARWRRAVKTEPGPAGPGG